MNKLTGMLIVLLLSACSIAHEIKIKAPPCLYPFKGFDFTICTPFIVIINGEKFIVPEGFTTDLASVPRILWSIYSPNRAETVAGAVLHDYLYFCPNGITRKEADSIFYDILVMEGISKRIAFKYWLGVRLFGQSHFNEGATCTHAYTRTENTISNLRMAFKATSRSF